jgi:hypothetical protein
LILLGSRAMIQLRLSDLNFLGMDVKKRYLYKSIVENNRLILEFQEVEKKKRGLFG